MRRGSMVLELPADSHKHNSTTGQAVGRGPEEDRDRRPTGEIQGEEGWLIEGYAPQKLLLAVQVKRQNS